MKSETLQLTHQYKKDLEDLLADSKKNFRTYWRLMRNAAAQGIGYRVLIGYELNKMRATLAHGEFEAWAEKQGLAKSTQHRYRQLSSLFLEEMRKRQKSHVGHLPPTKSLVKGKAKLELILEIAPIILDGRGEVEFMRDCKLLKAEGRQGGFQVDPAQLEEWLAKHHPELAGTARADLPKKIRAAFDKWVINNRELTLPQETAEEHALEYLASHEREAADRLRREFTPEQTIVLHAGAQTIEKQYAEQIKQDQENEP